MRSSEARQRRMGPGLPIDRLQQALHRRAYHSRSVTRCERMHHAMPDQSPVTTWVHITGRPPRFIALRMPSSFDRELYLVITRCRLRHRVVPGEQVEGDGEINVSPRLDNSGSEHPRWTLHHLKLTRIVPRTDNTVTCVAQVWCGATNVSMNAQIRGFRAFVLVCRTAVSRVIR